MSHPRPPPHLRHCSLSLGAVPTQDGVSFSVWSRNAVTIDLCLFDPADPTRETGRVRMARGEADVWRAFVSGLKPGALYGYRVHGPWLPANGMRFNANKLLLDPYAKAVAGKPDGRADMLSPDGPMAFPGALDNGATALKSVVVADDFDWEDDAPPEVPWSDTMIYEAHVKGFTQTHPHVPEHLRGTYAGMANEAATEYLRGLGVTTVQLLPVQQHLNDGFLVDRRLTNYWGYNTAAFFAPHNELAAARDPLEQVREFKGMVKALHRAGIEVILDVVYNHTAEGDGNGPMLMFRGFDDSVYYRHGFDDGTLYYSNLTGCGNAVASNNPAPLRLILDSLRYWVTEMRVDGFRFDLAVTVARDREHYHLRSPFFTALHQDPVLSRVKLIAEPWDMGREDSYQVGRFPEPWRELNGKYRDTTRRFWRGDAGVTAEFAKRLCGSDDVYGWNQRTPLASVNLITSHDGFTLRDLVSYEQKHNLANGENNRDGDNDNHSFNCGAEGETKKSLIIKKRARRRRSMIASMFCSVGVPFITAGDERGRTQRGNNNAYCQDNELSWIDWSACEDAMLEFTRAMAAFRKARPALRRSEFYDGRHNPDTGRRDVTWLNGTGGRLGRDEWHDPARRIFGAVIDEPENRNAPVNGHGEDHRPMLLIFNQGIERHSFILPGDALSLWSLVFDTALEPSFVRDAPPAHGGGSFEIESGSMACFVLSAGHGLTLENKTT